MHRQNFISDRIAKIVFMGMGCGFLQVEASTRSISMVKEASLSLGFRV